MSPPSGTDRRGLVARLRIPDYEAHHALGARASRSDAGLQSDPRFPRFALGLLAAAAAEESARRQDHAQAWLGAASSDAPSAEWDSYRRRLEAALSRETLDASEFRRLAQSAPNGAPASFSELRSVLQESDPEVFAESLLNLAQRNLHQERALAFTRTLLEVAATYPASRVRAEELLNLLTGRGTFAAGLEFQAPRLLRELSSPLSLASFGTAIWLSRAASLAVLARSSRLGWGTLLLSEGAAWSIEAPTMVLTRRLGTQLFEGGNQLLSPSNFGSELLAAYGSFAFLRLSSNAMSLAAPGLRRLAGLNVAEGGIGAFGGYALGGLRLASDVAAVMA